MRGYRRRGTASYLIGVAASFLLFSQLAASLLGARERPFWGLLVGDGREVRRVFAESPAALAGIREGDGIRDFAGAPWQEPWNRQYEANGQAKCTVDRPGVGTLEFKLEHRAPPLSEVLRAFVLAFVAGSFVIIGLVVFLSRSDRVASLFFLMCLFFSTALLPDPESTVRGSTFLALVVRSVAAVCLPPTFLHFFLSFPRRSRILHRLPGGPLLLYIPALILAPFVVMFAWDRVFSGTPPSAFLLTIENVAAMLFVAMVIGGIVAFISSCRKITSPLLRRSLKWVLPGTALGILPPLLLGAVLNFNPSWEIPGDRYIFLSLVFVPLSFGHAIVRYGLMDLELVVKRSAVYTALTALLVAIYYLVAVVLGTYVAELAGTGQRLLSFACVFAAALLFVPMRDRLQELVDRTFYRTRYSYRRSLRQFSGALASFLDREEIVRLLLHRLPSLVEVDRVALYLRSGQEDALQLAGMRGLVEADLPWRSFRASRSLTAWWREIGGPLPLEETSTPHRMAKLPPSEQQLFSSLAPGLIVVLPGEQEIEGILVLGEKNSGDAYRAEDLELLGTLGNQAGTALSVARLHGEALEKRRMEEELAVARKIQKSLLPSHIPQRDGFEIAAMTRPCRQVGGDFYDFLDFGGEGVGLAVADVSGKGVPAALILSNLQATLRAEARAGRSPVPVVRRINDRLCGDLEAGSFASLLFGHLDVVNRRFQYVNAGHPAGLIVRKSGTLTRLTEGGVLLGVVANASYALGAETLDPGDLLLLYSDGVTDVLNAEEEEFGDERLEALLPTLVDLPVEEILERIVGHVERFVGGNLPDDLTLLVTRACQVLAPSPSPPAPESIPVLVQNQPFPAS